MEPLSDREISIIVDHLDETADPVHRRIIDKLLNEDCQAITYLYKEDIERVLSPNIHLNSVQMRKLADKMETDYCNQLFNESLRTTYEEYF